MERTTIYLDDTLKHILINLSAEESKKRGKRVGMAEMIRDALVEYLKKRGITIKESELVEKRMLSTRGALGEDFERRVKELQKEYKKWKI
ncbi:MAG: hypothetical protein HY578_04855 [Nitrospinae bacterium]|nr:hypothetical protein [Nitrospinota bacterium]